MGVAPAPALSSTPGVSACGRRVLAAQAHENKLRACANPLHLGCPPQELWGPEPDDVASERRRVGALMDGGFDPAAQPIVVQELRKDFKGSELFKRDVKVSVWVSTVASGAPRLLHPQSTPLRQQCLRHASLPPCSRSRHPHPTLHPTPRTHHSDSTALDWARLFLRRAPPHSQHAVQDLTLALDAGECFGLLGPNGAGKVCWQGVRVTSQVTPTTHVSTTPDTTRVSTLHHR